MNAVGMKVRCTPKSNPSPNTNVALAIMEISRPQRIRFSRCLPLNLIPAENTNVLTWKYGKMS